jgi:hypothetical protein
MDDEDATRENVDTVPRLLPIGRLANGGGGFFDALEGKKRGAGLVQFDIDTYAKADSPRGSGSPGRIFVLA